jgi:hypothetical protein
MKFLTWLCCGTLLAAAVHVESANPPAAVPARAPGTPEAELVSLTNAWTAAILAKDRSKLESLMSPEYKLQGWEGSWEVERPQWLENTMHSYEIAEYHHSDIVPHVYGDVAAITSRWYWRGKRGVGEKQPFEEHGYCVDMWRHANGTWQVVSRLTIIMPGKEEPSSKHD